MCRFSGGNSSALRNHHLNSQRFAVGRGLASCRAVLSGGTQRMRRIILSLAMVITIPISAGAQQPIPISLKQAVDAALEPDGNTGIQLAEQMVRQAEARAALARASLLPDMSAAIGQ